MPLIGTTSPDYSTTLAAALNAGAQVEFEAASGAIGINRGTAIITKAGVAVLTLASPVAGVDDGKTLAILSTTAFAHTITTPAGGLNGALHIATCAANAGSVVELRAYNGSWWMLNNVGVTLT